MEITFWIFTIVTAVVFIGAGSLKQIKSKGALKEMGLGWTEEYTQRQVRLIGISEILGGLGVILPIVTGVATFLAPIAAGALTLVMIGATVVHIRRKDPPFTIGLIVVTLVTMILSIVHITR